MIIDHARATAARALRIGLGVFVASQLFAGAAAAQTITAGATSGSHGTQVTIPVTLQNGGLNYFAATEARVAFDPLNIPIAAKADGTPDCTVNPFVNKQASFAFWPSGCTGSSCQQLRSSVYFTAQSQNGLIPDGSILYTCKINISSSAPPGQYPLVVTGTRGSTSVGIVITTTGVDGYVNVF